MNQPIYALLVGIDHYASLSVPDLGGCVNDVMAMAATLHSRFAVPATQITTLVNEQATYTAIKAAFQHQLMEPLRAHPQPAPAVLFHFSGHGSQAPDERGQKSSGWDETIVCHDSRMGDVDDLRDWELGELIDELAQYTDNITVILDCCHSGSGTREGEIGNDNKPVSNTRGCERAQRRQRTMVTTARSAASRPAARSRKTTLSRRANHVLLAACLNHELANEYTPPAQPAEPSNTNADLPLQRQRYGALTYHLVQALDNIDPVQLPTYYELYETLKPQISARFSQTIQCEGDWGRVLFGVARPDRDLWLTVVEQRGAHYLINGGAVHTVQLGAQFQVYSPETRTRAEASAPIGLLEVVEVGVVQSTCRLVEGAAPVPLNARLDPLLATVAPRRTLALGDLRDEVAQPIRERLAQPDLAPVIALHPRQEEAELRIVLVNQDFEIQTNLGARLGEPYAMRQLNPYRRPFQPSDFEPLVEALKRIVRVQTLAALENIDSVLNNALEITIKELIPDPQTSSQIAGTPVPLNDTTAIIASGAPFVIEITNRHWDALYVGVLAIRGSWQVDQLYPELHGTHVKLMTGKRLYLGLDDDAAHQLRLTLNKMAATGQPAAEDVILLVIATKQETDFESLLQRETEAAARMRVQWDRPRRAFKTTPEADPKNEWLVKRLRLQITP